MRRFGPLLAAVAVTLAVLLGAQLLRERRRVQHQSQTVVEAVRRVVKLSTVEMNLSNWQLRRDAKDLLGFIPISCEKTVALFYRGKVAAGFDLDGPQGFGVRIDDAAGVARPRVLVRLPPARILYTDVPSPELVIADGSLCNRIEPDDYTRLHGEARAAVQREALAAGILRRAETHARSLIEEVVRPLGHAAVVTFGPASSEARPVPTPSARPAAGR